MILQKQHKFLVIASLLICLSACMPGTLSEHEESINTLVVNNPAVKEAQFISGTKTLNYRYIETQGEAILVFIHGTPGNWKSLAHFLVDPALSEASALRISIDRPGWEKDSSDTTSILSLAAQSELIAAFVSSLRKQQPETPIILIGHSYGATLAIRALMDQPDAIDGALLLAGPVDPKLAKPRWYHRLANTWLLKKALGNGLNKANIEMIALQADLTAMVPFWPSIQAPISVVLGQDDKLVHQTHGDFISEQLSPQQLRLIRLEDQGHFIPWQRHELVLQEIQLLLSTLAANTSQ